MIDLAWLHHSSFHFFCLVAGLIEGVYEGVSLSAFVLTLSISSVYFLLIMHTLKLAIFAPACMFVTYYAKKGDAKAVSFYTEAWEWRQ